MKKESIITALLLVGPSHQLQAQDITAARAQVRVQRQELVELSFQSKTTSACSQWELENNNHWVEKKVDCYSRISFINANGNYQYDGSGVMEYEVLIDFMTKEGKALNSVDSSYYAKRIDENTFKLFDCDSSRVCSDETSNIVFHIFDTPNGKVLKFKQSSKKEHLSTAIAKEYFELKD